MFIAQKTEKELAELKKQMLSMGWNDKVVELDNAIEAGELVIVQTAKRSKHIDFCSDIDNKEQYRVSEEEVAKLTSFNYEPTTYNKSDSNLMKAAGERFERYYMESRTALNLQIKSNTSQVIFTKYKKYN